MNSQSLEVLGLTNDLGDSDHCRNRGRTKPYCGSYKCAGYDPRRRVLKNMPDRGTYCPDCGHALIYEFDNHPPACDKRHDNG